MVIVGGVGEESIGGIKVNGNKYNKKNNVKKRFKRILQFIFCHYGTIVAGGNGEIKALH